MADNNQTLWNMIGRGTLDPTKYATDIDRQVAEISANYNPNDGWRNGTNPYKQLEGTGVQDGIPANWRDSNPALALWEAQQYRGHDLDPAYQRILKNANDERLKVWIGQQSPELRAILNAPVANKSYAQKVGVDPNAASQSILNQLGMLQQAGLNYGNKAGSAENQMKYLAGDLARYGVSDLNNLKAYQVQSPTTGKMTDIFYDSKTGAIVPTDFGSDMSGEGGNWYKLKNVNGRAIPVNSWADTSEAGDYIGALSVLAMPVTAGLTSYLAPMVSTATGLGTAGATALTGAGVSGLTQGALTAAGGGDFGKGFLGGALGSGIGSAVGALNPAGMLGVDAATSPTLSSAINKGIAGGLQGATNAAINKQDIGDAFGRGALGGAISGALAPNISDLFGNDEGSKMLAGVLAGQAGKLGTNALLGQPSQATTPVGGLTQATNQAAASNTAATSGPRQLNISHLPQQAQDNIRKAYGALTQYGANLRVKI